MPSAIRAPRSEPELEAAPPRYTLEELRAVRRNVLRYARLFPPGPERNQHRQIARSLRRLSLDPAWLERQTRDEPAPARWPARGLRCVLV